MAEARGRGPATGKSLGSVLADVLAEELPELSAGPGTSPTPILAKRKRVEERLAQAKRRAAKDAAESRARRQLKRRGHVPLGARAAHASGLDADESIYDAGLEALMRQVATRGVVRLFNAVTAAQAPAAGAGAAAAEAKARGAKGGEQEVLSKEAFLQQLKQQPTQPSGAPYLRDDYLLSGRRRAKTFDDARAEDGADGDGEEDEDADGALEGEDEWEADGAEADGDDDDDDDDDDDLE